MVPAFVIEICPLNFRLPFLTTALERIPQSFFEYDLRKSRLACLSATSSRSFS